jgi:hypothetical protein
MDERVRKDTGGKAIEYVYFQGTAVAEKDVSPGYWSDYIFFDGRRIARANNFEHQLHISGQKCANCGSQYYHYIFEIPVRRSKVPFPTVNRNGSLS